MSEDGNDPRLLLLAGLELSDCRIEFSSTPIVLLCGGSVPQKLHPDAPDPPIESLRHGIVSAHTKFEIFRPEEIPSWHSDGVFKDLVSFELELASICSLVVIILESEGSLVELGAFSQQPDLSNKIVAICASQYVNDSSFINLGILRFIAEKNSSYVRSYPWQTEKPAVIPSEVVDDVVSDIQQELDKLPKSQVLKIDQNSHVMAIICELLRLFSALKENEILEYLQLLGSDVNKFQLKGKLFLLRSFKLIKIQQYSDAVFYMHGSEPYHSIRLALKDKSKPLDTLRVELQCLEFYKQSDKHRNRNRAISQAKGKLP